MPKRVSLTMSDEDYARFTALAEHHRRTLAKQILASLDSSYRASQKYLPPPVYRLNGLGAATVEFEPVYQRVAE